MRLTRKSKPTSWLGRNKKKSGIAAAAAGLAIPYVTGAVRTYRNTSGTTPTRLKAAFRWPVAAAKSRSGRRTSGGADTTAPLG